MNIYNNEYANDAGYPHNWYENKFDKLIWLSLLFALKRIAVRCWKSRFECTDTDPSLSERRIVCTNFATCKPLLKFVNVSGRLLELTVIIVSTLSFDELWTFLTMFLIESGESVFLKGLKFFRKSCKICNRRCP